MRNVFMRSEICAQETDSRTTAGYEAYEARRCTQKGCQELGLGLVHGQWARLAGRKCHGD